MKDYIDKINREMESSSKAQESAWAMGTRLKPRINEKRVDSSVQLEASMSCFFFTDFIADRMIATQLDLQRLMRDDDTVNDTVNDTVKDADTSQLSKTEQAVLNAISSHPDYSYEQLAAICSVSRPTIARAVKSLQVYNRIRRVGSDKTGHWEVIDESKSGMMVFMSI